MNTKGCLIFSIAAPLSLVLLEGFLGPTLRGPCHHVTTTTQMATLLHISVQQRSVLGWFALYGKEIRARISLPRIAAMKSMVLPSSTYLLLMAKKGGLCNE